MSKLELIFSKIVQDSQDYGSNNEAYDIENILHNRWNRNMNVMFDNLYGESYFI